MPRYVEPEHKASCTVTFRLTTKDRRLMEYLAEVLGVSQTELLRQFLAAKAELLGIEDAPTKPRPRRGRPRLEPATSRPAPRPAPAEAAAPAPLASAPRSAPRIAEMADIPIVVEEEPATRPGPATLSTLATAFREHFSGRADGTRRELEDCLFFLTAQSHSGGPLLSGGLALDELTPEILAHLRERIRAMNERVARKNLHLTYLRMMLQFAARDERFSLRPSLGDSIPPFTAVEVATGMFKGRPPGE